MHRRQFMHTLGAGGIGVAIGGAARKSDGLQSQRPPNVILVITDDQGYGDLSCLGSPVLETPHLDRLHAGSTRLTNFHVDPTCSPTRASVLTGRYSSRTGVWHTIMGRSLLWPGEVTMADVFRTNGYRTGIFGKWHLGDNYPYRPEDRGFDETLVIGGGAIGNTPDYWNNDYFDDTYRRNGRWERASGYCTDVFFDAAVEFIRRSGNQPFFAYVATNTPHWPHNVAEEFAEPYRKVVSDRTATFFGMIANIDANIGRLRSFLTESGLEENTIFIFMTDNGTSFGAEFDAEGFVKDGYNAGMRGSKGTIYDGGHRVPCFIRWPKGGIDAGTDVPNLTAHIDLLPTLVDLCGLKAASGPPLDGRSLRPLLSGRPQEDERLIIVHNQRVDFPIKGKDFVVMTPRWRLVNGRELYDIVQDPEQRHDIAARHREIVEKLRPPYERWWTDTSTHFEDYARIPVGTRFENPVTLTSHDIHGQVTWDQTHVRRNARCDGFWAIDVAREGLYDVELRRWPVEADIPITSAPEGATVMRATYARLKIADRDLITPVGDADKAARFAVRLDRQTTNLQGWFVDGRGNGGVNCAYYAYVRLR